MPDPKKHGAGRGPRRRKPGGREADTYVAPARAPERVYDVEDDLPVDVAKDPHDEVPYVDDREERFEERPVAARREEPRVDDRRTPRTDDEDRRGSAVGGRREARVVPTEEEYQLHVQYDRGERAFVGTALEFPALHVTAATRELAFEQLVDAVDSETEIRRRRGEPLPEPAGTWRYPETLEVHLSAAVFRRLDTLSRQERMPVEALAAEMLAIAAEKRFDTQPARPAQSSGGGGGRSQNQRGGGGGGGGGNNRRNNSRQTYNQTMDNRENFLEYVRNLEKNGGPGYRKK